MGSLSLLFFFLLSEVKSHETWRDYSSYAKEVPTPLYWPHKAVPYLFKSNFTTEEKYIIQYVFKKIK